MCLCEYTITYPSWIDTSNHTFVQYYPIRHMNCHTHIMQVMCLYMFVAHIFVLYIIIYVNMQNDTRIPKFQSVCARKPSHANLRLKPQNQKIVLNIIIHINSIFDTPL